MYETLDTWIKQANTLPQATFFWLWLLDLRTREGARVQALIIYSLHRGLWEDTEQIVFLSGSTDDSDSWELGSICCNVDFPGSEET